MNPEAVKEKIEEWIQPLLAEKNLFLVDIKISMGRSIEVFADSDEGIQIYQCAELSRFIEKNLDGSGLVPDNYVLEVSSPGMDNPLRVPRQYKRRIGRVLEVLKTNGEMLVGQLTEVTDTGIKLKEIEEEKKKKKKGDVKKTSAEPEAPKEYELPFDEIKRALLQFKF